MGNWQASNQTLVTETQTHPKGLFRRPQKQRLEIESSHLKTVRTSSNDMIMRGCLTKRHLAKNTHRDKQCGRSPQRASVKPTDSKMTKQRWKDQAKTRLGGGISSQVYPQNHTKTTGKKNSQTQLGTTAVLPNRLEENAPCRVESERTIYTTQVSKTHQSEKRTRGHMEGNQTNNSSVNRGESTD